MNFYQHPLWACIFLAALYATAIHMARVTGKRIHTPPTTTAQDVATFDKILVASIWILILIYFYTDYEMRYGRLASYLLTSDWPTYAAEFIEWCPINHRGASSEWNAIIYTNGALDSEAVGIMNLARGECLTGGEKIVILSLKDINLPNTYILRYQPVGSDAWVEMLYPLDPYKRLPQMCFWLVVEAMLAVGVPWYFMWRGYRAAPRKELYGLAFLWGLVILATNVCAGYTAGQILYGTGQAEHLRYCLLAFYWESLIAVALTLWLTIQYYVPGATWHTVRKSLE